MQKRIIFSLFALCALACGMSAENRWGVIDRPHEIRVGWGDQLFETLMWHKPNAVITSMPTTWQKTYKEDFVYSQHIWVEYHYRFKYWISFGGMIDCSGVQWDDVIRGRRTNISSTSSSCLRCALPISIIRMSTSIPGLD